MPAAAAAAFDLSVAAIATCPLGWSFACRSASARPLPTDCAGGGIDCRVSSTPTKLSQTVTTRTRNHVA
eukprot:5914884-Pyramimonas_sp.AAC.2